jgi:hypothetical protein
MSPRIGRHVTYSLAVLIVIWLCGLLFFAGQHLNDLRVVLNNLAPGAPPSESPAPRPERVLFMAASTLPLFPSYLGIMYLAAMLLLGRLFNFDPTKSYSLANIDPALLNEAGRNHLKRVSRHQLITLAWASAGLVLITWMSYSNS